MENPRERYWLEHGQPSPPPRHVETEEYALEIVSQNVVEIDQAGSHEELVYEDVRLVGEFPRTRIEVLFRWERYPRSLFGRRVYVWGMDGTYGPHEIGDFVMFIGLEVPHRRKGLPPPEPDASGIVWI